MMSKVATFGAGCFWGVEETFRTLKGVEETAVGYANGQTDNPTYREVCSGTTGHAEVIEVTFDPTQISYNDLLNVFWACHDPTQLNRQGPDTGTQYRSAIFTHDAEQAEAALNARSTWEAANPGHKAATVIEEAKKFWAAEDYHQKYLMKRGGGACH